MVLVSCWCNRNNWGVDENTFEHDASRFCKPVTTWPNNNLDVAVFLLNQASFQVMEQKETSTGLVDDVCGSQVVGNHAGLCGLHYKEYLVGSRQTVHSLTCSFNGFLVTWKVNLINDNQLDPANIFTTNELLACLSRSEIEVPEKESNCSEDEYKEMLLCQVKRLSLTHNQDWFYDVTIRAITRGGETPLEIFSPLLENCVGHSLKIWSPSENSSPPPWYSKLVTGLVTIRTVTQKQSKLMLLRK